jgi:uncharacterized membrane protein YdjX (TVP38/TMEM64 family)
LRKDSIVALSTLLVLIGWVGWSYWTDGIIGLLFAADLDAAAKVDGLRDFFDGWGMLAPAMYVLIVVVEAVVAPIPGAMLYLPGGMIFGGFWGGTLSLVGNVIGAGTCCLLMRSIVGRTWSREFFSEDRLEGARRFILRHGILSVAILRVNPLTSSDIVSYAAGLTPLSTLTVMIGTGIGMLPLCYAQSYLSEGLFTRFPWLIWPLAVGCVLYAVLAAVAIWKLRLPPAADKEMAG